MDTTKAITHLSLCAGYDGIGIGLERVLPSLRTIAYVEIEAFAIANLVSKMESEQLDAAPIYSDVKTFPYKEFCGRVDILSGGFPCQPFSCAGHKKGVEDPRHLYPHFSRGIEECKPRIVFLENVEGIISSKTHDGESVLHYVLKDLERLGYRATAGVFSASEVGFPHQRKRVFIMGHAKHNGYVTTKGLQCFNEAGPRNQKEQREAKQSERTSKSRISSSIQGCDELSDTENIGCRGRSDRNDSGRWDIQEQTPQKQSDIWGQVKGCSRNISDTNSKGLEGHTRNKDIPRYVTTKNDIWMQERIPRRPNQEQHEWEEPRVKPKLGRTTNGSSSRVDRLRLLGNGVVPQTATKAFVVLMNRLLTNTY